MGGNEMKQYIYERKKLRMKESSQFGGYDTFGN